MLSNIKNGQLAKKNFIYQKRNKVCESVLKLLWSEGFIIGYTISKNDSNMLKIFLKYQNSIPVIKSIKSISKPSKRIYLSSKQIWKVYSLQTFIIFSTNQGIKSILDCKKLNIGGEPLAVIS